MWADLLHAQLSLNRRSIVAELSLNCMVLSVETTGFVTIVPLESSETKTLTLLFRGENVKYTKHILSIRYFPRLLSQEMLLPSVFRPSISALSSTACSRSYGVSMVSEISTPEVPVQVFEAQGDPTQFALLLLVRFANILPFCHGHMPLVALKSITAMHSGGCCSIRLLVVRDSTRGEA